MKCDIYPGNFKTCRQHTACVKCACYDCMCFKTDRHNTIHYKADRHKSSALHHLIGMSNQNKPYINLDISLYFFVCTRIHVLHSHWNHLICLWSFIDIEILNETVILPFRLVFFYTSTDMNRPDMVTHIAQEFLLYLNTYFESWHQSG